MKPIYLLLAAMPLMAFTAKGTKDNPDMLPSGQPVSERNAQNMLPMGGGTLWNTLLQSKISYSNVTPHITATLTPDIKGLDGKTLSAEGFVLPLDANSASKHFLLSKRTPTCPFCPPGEPNEVIEVFCAKPVKVDDGLISVRGKFTLTNNTDNGIFFVMKEAEVSAPVSSPTGQPAGSNKPTMY